MNPRKYAFKNYIFDFYGTLVDIETDESSPFLWDSMAQIYQSYGAHYTGESLQARYKELVKQAEESIAKEKQVTYPEIDLTGAFDCSDLPCSLSQTLGALPTHERSLRRYEGCRLSALPLI